VIDKPFNLSSIRTSGIDLEASYQFNLHQWNIPGAFVIRGLATHVFEFTVNTGIPGQPVLHLAGDNSFNEGSYTSSSTGITPHWKAAFTETWSMDRINVGLTERIVSDGVINPDWVQCTSGCPVPTIQHPTINNDVVAGAVYLDVNGSYRLKSGPELYFKIDNLFDQSPPPYGNVSLYDYFGRVYHVGMRVDF
jgi:outer membrane receptor protein involved in Fe transport